jgi:peptide/nickel transport system substrate-binding protein
MDKRFVSVILVAALLVAAFVVIAGCTSPTPTATPTPGATASPVPTPTPGKNFTIVNIEAGEPESLDPAYDYETAGAEILQNVYETLVFYRGSDATKVYGLLAKDWTVSPDGKVYTFNLQDNVTFHDGTKFNASAVNYSYYRAAIMALDPVGANMLPYIAGGQAYLDSEKTQADIDALITAAPFKVLNETTFQITLADPYPAFIFDLTFTCWAVISPTYVEANGGYSPNTQSVFMTEHLMGTGPFMFTEWAHKDHITMTRNDNYWGTKALPAKVIVRYADDYNTRLLALDKGDADLIYATPVYANDLKNDTNAVIKSGPSLAVMYIGFNQAMPPFDNKTLRKAFCEAFDYDTYVNQVLNGYALRTNGPIPQGLAGYNASHTMYQFNPTDSKKLFESLGYTKSKPSNFTIYYNAGNDGRKTACLLLKDAIEKMDIGIRIDVQEIDWPTYTLMNREKKLPLFYLGWQADYPSADNFIGPFAWSKGYYADKVSYKNPAIDALYVKAIKELNPQTQFALYDQITDLVNDDYAYMWVDQGVNFWVTRPELHGFVYNPMVNNVGSLYSTMYK